MDIKKPHAETHFRNRARLFYFGRKAGEDQKLVLGFLGVRTDTLGQIGLNDPKGGFVTLKGQLESLEHTFRRVVVHDDALGDRDGIGGESDRLRIETEINDQFFGSAGNTAEVRVTANRFFIIDLNDARSFLLGLGLFDFIRHFKNPFVKKKHPPVSILNSPSRQCRKEKGGMETFGRLKSFKISC